MASNSLLALAASTKAIFCSSRCASDTALPCAVKIAAAVPSAMIATRPMPPEIHQREAVFNALPVSGAITLECAYALAPLDPAPSRAVALMRYPLPPPGYYGRRDGDCVRNSG